MLGAHSVHHLLRLLSQQQRHVHLRFSHRGKWCCVRLLPSARFTIGWCVDLHVCNHNNLQCQKSGVFVVVANLTLYFVAVCVCVCLCLCATPSLVGICAGCMCTYENDEGTGVYDGLDFDLFPHDVHGSSRSCADYASFCNDPVYGEVSWCWCLCLCWCELHCAALQAVVCCGVTL